MINSRILILACFLLLSLSINRSLPTAAATLDDAVPDEILLAVPDQDDNGLQAALAAGIGRAVGFEPRLGVYRIRLRPELRLEAALDLLRRLPGIRFAEPNLVAQAAIAPGDPLATEQYGPQQVRADQGWEIWQPKSPVVIAIADTGIDGDHPDLSRKMLRDASGIVGFDALTRKRSSAQDTHYHGTHCAGIAAAETGNHTGIAGVAGWDGTLGRDSGFIRLMPVKVLNSSGVGNSFTVSSGITWAVDNGAQVISLSLHLSSQSQAMDAAVNYALSRGCVVVTAAGNSGSSAPSYPASIGGVISVAATSRDDTLTSFSTFGTWVTTAAPGDRILSTLPTYTTSEMRLHQLPTQYGLMSGTSMACPHVAGEAALILSQNPQLSPSQVRNLIAFNVDPYTPYHGRTLGPGVGRVNVARALAAAGVAPGPAVVTRLLSVALSPTSVTNGASSVGTVRLLLPAPSQGSSVALSSSNTGVAIVPASVTVPGGQTMASFSITTASAASTATAEISATLDGVTRKAGLTVAPTTLASVSVPAGTLSSGSSATGRVTLSGPAPSEGATISLSSSRSDLAAVPRTITLPAGATTATFSIATRTIVPTPPTAIQVGITASWRGVSRGATLSLR